MATRWNVRTTNFFAARAVVSSFSRSRQLARLCGYPFFGMLAGPRVCPHCAELDPLFDQGKTLFLAKGPARSIIHVLKYQYGFYALEDVKAMIAKAPYYKNYFDGGILVPVPLHPTKERERGFNQSLMIAKSLKRGHCGQRPTKVTRSHYVHANSDPIKPRRPLPKCKKCLCFGLRCRCNTKSNLYSNRRRIYYGIDA